MSKKTFVTKKKDIRREWYFIDAYGLILGRLATKVANLLRGKDKPYFSPSVDCGDYVVVVNTKYIKVTGNKEKQKKYYRHSGYPGGLKEATFEEVMDKDSTLVLQKAVKGMLPKNKLSAQIIKKLKVYPELAHPHQAQKLKKIEIK